jgi:hypothetical protein
MEYISPAGSLFRRKFFENLKLIAIILKRFMTKWQMFVAVTCY